MIEVLKIAVIRVTIYLEHFFVDKKTKKEKKKEGEDKDKVSEEEKPPTEEDTETVKETEKARAEESISPGNKQIFLSLSS